MTKKRVLHAPRPAPPASDRWLAYATLPLRLFLGATFVYAGLQKMADPGFLQPGSSTYIGTQLQAYAGHSPIGFLITFLALPVPQLTGIGVIATEVAVGVLVLAGLATRWAAAAGALVNFVFFLTASWTVQPYFLGSDSIYTVAWITLVLTGDQRVLTLRPVLLGPAAAPTGKRIAADLGRRKLLFQLGGAAVAGVWVLSLLPRIRTTGGSTAASSTPAPTASPTPVASPTGTRIGALSDLQSRGFIDFTVAANGDPGIAVSLPGGGVVAFDAVCTHAGCNVGYDTTAKLLSCPCHGATFDPANGASVVSGPAPTPLTAIQVQVGADGGVYAG